MLKQILNDNWEMCSRNDQQWLAASVPGSVYTELYQHQKMPDPYWKDNEHKALLLMEQDYEYRTTFTVLPDLFAKERIILCFESVDTIADIYLNDKLLGRTVNQHRIWEFEVKSYLLAGENHLQVVLHSPLRYIREEFQKCPTFGTVDGMDGFVHIRKAHYMFGWDWGAHLPDAGILRPVSLLGFDGGRFQSVYIRQLHEEKKVTLQFEITPEGDGEDYRYEIQVISPSGQVFKNGTSNLSVEIKEPRLWWPNGYGAQPLYEVQVEMFNGDQHYDSWHRRIGLRTVTVERKKDEWGESFAQQVNGVNLFAMGADYIPEDHLLGRVSRERTKELLMACKSANFNVIRVWGGGYYPEDFFFDLCDELGLLVWQDFMFACAVYELTQEFKDNIRQEFIDNIKRIRHHASLGLWCGNNEMEMFLAEKHPMATKASEYRDYFIMYESLLPEVLAEHDPETFYWPASPSSGGSFDEPNDENRGDVHYWEVWHGGKPFTDYRNHYFRYLSEFGFQAFPSLKTIETFTDDPKDFNAFSYIMDKHQRSGSANGTFMRYLSQSYLYPGNFADFIYATQLLQGDAIRYGVEHFRRNRGRCMGTVYWQLNDCWPVISWSSIDYTGRWKALHYYARRFFAPLLISAAEEGFLTAGEDMNREHFQIEKSFRLNVVNETMEDRELTVSWALRDVKGRILKEEQQTIRVLALTASWLDQVVLSKMDERSSYVSYDLSDNRDVLSSGTLLLTAPKYFHFEDPQLSYRVQGDVITISAEAYAKSVEILNEEEDLILSDNYFDMNAGRKQVRILKGSAKGIRLRSVYDIR